jgi:hypothetical protein
MLPSNDLTFMRAAQLANMPDSGHVQTRVVTPNATTNEQVETWPSDSAETACGLDMRPGGMRRGEKFSTISYDATLRLPLGTAIKADDHFKVDKRFGETLSVPLVFTVLSPVQQGPSCIRVLLNRIEV